MSEESLFELVLEVTSLHSKQNLNTDNLRGRIAFEDLAVTLHYQEQVVLHIDYVQPDSQITLDFNVNELKLGAISVTLGELFPEQLHGTVLKTFYLPEMEDCYINIAFSLISMEQKEKMGIEGPSLQSSCPYLKKMAMAHQYEREAQQVLARLREEIGPFLGVPEEEGFKSPVRQGSRSPVKSPTRSPTRGSAGGKSPYRRAVSRPVNQLESYPEIEIPSRFQLEFRKMSNVEIEKVRNLVIAMCEKLRLMKIQIQEVDYFKQEIESCQTAQNELEVSMKETEDQVGQVSSTLKEYQDEILYQTERSKENTENHQNRIQSLQQRLKELQQELEEAEEENKQLKGITEENIDRELEHLREEYQESEQKRLKVQEEFKQKVKEYSQNQKELTQQRQDLSFQKLNLEQQLEDIYIHIDKLNLENSQLNVELQKLKGAESIEANLKQKLMILQATGQEDKFGIVTLKQKLEDMKKQYDNYIRQATELDQLMQRDTKNLSQQAQKIENNLHERENSIKQYKEQEATLKENLDSLQQLFNMKQNLEQTYDKLNKSNNSYQNTKDQILNEMSWVADYFLLHSRSTLQEHRVHNRVQDVWEQKKFELEALKHSVYEEKMKNPIYIPLKGDIVDEALAEYLNSRDEIIHVPFIREASEVYHFGTKRIWLKFEKGKLSARVGGGFLPIDDFIEAYTDVEIEKFEYKHREVSPDEKRALGKFAAGVVGENSPKSPKKIREELVKAVESGEFATAYGVKRGNSPSRGFSPSRTRATVSPDKRFQSP